MRLPNSTHFIFIRVASFFANFRDFPVCGVSIGVQLQTEIRINFYRIQKWVFLLKMFTWKYSTPVRLNSSSTVRDSGGSRWCSSRWSVSASSMYQARTILRIHSQFQSSGNKFGWMIFGFARIRTLSKFDEIRKLFWFLSLRGNSQL